jgi:hypothetical protein
MSEEVLFATDPVAPAAPIADPAIEPAPAPTLTIPAEAADLIGEGKKYPNIEVALAALPHAQNHISTLERENSEYKEKLMSNEKLDLVLQKLSTPTPPVVSEPTKSENGVSREDLSSLVQQEIAQSAKVNREEANLSSVELKLRETYGDSVGQVFNEGAAKVGMSPAQLTTLAKVAPKAVLDLLGENKSGVTTVQPTSEGVNLATVGDIGEPVPKQNIMFGASTKELVSEWQACAPKSEE